MQKDTAINVLDEPLQPCSEEPMTGFFRDGFCNTCAQDVGVHTVCIEASEEFLRYSLAQGNDLSTPLPDYGFVGLKPGDRWCLCAARWLQAHADGCAPKVHLTRTHKRSLEVVPLALLKAYARDLN